MSKGISSKLRQLFEQGRDVFRATFETGNRTLQQALTVADIREEKVGNIVISTV